ncbi:MAG: hypothetical protein NTW87_29060 [Planctomycetota bacterium]|nr:hypothetical protein [Planctomycetota bacterium]
MRLVSFGPLGRERLGALTNGGRQIVDLNKADKKIPATLLEFLQGDFGGKARKVLADTPQKAIVSATGVRLGAPVPRP